MDTLCFEGGLFNRRVLRKSSAGPRFFIYWDDTMYGYRASKVTNPIVVPDVILRRTREIAIGISPACASSTPHPT